MSAVMRTVHLPLGSLFHLTCLPNGHLMRVERLLTLTNCRKRLYCSQQNRHHRNRVGFAVRNRLRTLLQRTTPLSQTLLTVKTRTAWKKSLKTFEKVKHPKVLKVSWCQSRHDEGAVITANTRARFRRRRTRKFCLSVTIATASSGTPILAISSMFRQCVAFRTLF